MAGQAAVDAGGASLQTAGPAEAAARPMDVDASTADAADNAAAVQHEPASSTPSTTRSRVSPKCHCISWKLMLAVFDCAVTSLHDPALFNFLCIYPHARSSILIAVQALAARGIQMYICGPQAASDACKSQPC